MKKKIFIAIIVVVILVGAIGFYMIDRKFHFFKQAVYTAADFGFEDVVSEVDQDQDGIEDYRDIVEGAKTYIQTKPTYKSVYYAKGYPDDEYGVCTDVVWQAFQKAGYSLKELIDEDIKNNKNLYPNVEKIDPNIDFRRVLNLKVYFDRHLKVLTNDQKLVEQWQPGDIVLTSTHIMILSNKRNKDGLPFIIHHDNFGARERNELMNYEIIGHYRFILE